MPVIAPVEIANSASIANSVGTMAPTAPGLASPPMTLAPASPGRLVASWLLRVAKGAAIALAFIIPGVSGGVMAAVLGLYERLLRFLANARQGFARELLFFAPVGVGGVVGLVLLSGPLNFALDRWPVVTLWAFAGAIVGTVPLLRREAARAGGPATRGDLLWLVGSTALGGVILYSLPLLGVAIPHNFLGFLIAGAVIGLGVVIPGLSGTALLVVFGIYQAMLEGLSSLDLLGVFLPVGLGAAAAVLAFSKLMVRFFDRQPSRVYHCIIGLVIASAVLIVLPEPGSAGALAGGASAGDPYSNLYAGATLVTYLNAAIAGLSGLVIGLLMARLSPAPSQLNPTP